MQYVFLIGTGRCGTKWVNDWLGSSEFCAVGPEPHVYPSVASLFASGYSCDPLTWLNGDRRYLDSLVVGFLEKFYSYRANDKTTHIVDSCPANFFHMELIQRLFPSAKFVHLYRDGKYVVYSIKKTIWGRDFSVRHWSDFWVQHTKTIFDEAFNQKYDILPVCYEKLVSDPSCSSKISEFLNLPHPGDIQPWKKPINTRYNCDDPERWKEMDQEDLAEMSVMNEMLTKLGYSPLPFSVSKMDYSYKLYTIKGGDSLSGLFGNRWLSIYYDEKNEDFRRTNPNPDQIRIGDSIYVPDNS